MRGYPQFSIWIPISLAKICVFHIVTNCKKYLCISSKQLLRHSPDQIGIWNCWCLRKEENRSTRRDASQSKDENQKQTQPTYGVKSGNQTRAALVGGKCSQHCAISARQADNLEYCKTKLRSSFVSLLIDILFSSASGKIDDQIFINKNISAPGVLRFHPYEPYLAVADRGGVRYVVLYFIAAF